MSARDSIHIRDPIHGTLSLTPDELMVVESPVYQRLRGIKQLGFTDHAFPGATHTRFAHALGAMHLAGRMFDVLFPAGDEQWIPADQRQRLRQLLRLSVLLHDVGHAPLSHATESCMPPRGALGLEGPELEAQQQATHEDYTVLLITRPPLAETLRRGFAALEIEPEDVAHLICPRFERSAAKLLIGGVDFQPLLTHIVSGELDADRMDYLQRDSFYTGVSYGKFDEQWLLHNLDLHVEDDKAYLALQHRAIFAFEDFLLSRYHMFISVYYHHTAIGYDTMLGRLIEDEPELLALPTEPEPYLAYDDVRFWSLLRASPNPWARRIVTRDLYRRILELHAAQEAAEIGLLEGALDEAGVEYFISRDESVLSRYYAADARSEPIFVINRGLGRVSRVDEYSPLYQRYAQPARLVRVYVRPDQQSTARACLESVARAARGRQLHLEWK